MASRLSLAWSTTTGSNGGLTGVLGIDIAGLPPDDEVFADWSDNSVRAPVIADFRTDSNGTAVQSSVDVGRLAESRGVGISLSAASVPNQPLWAASSLASGLSASHPTHSLSNAR